MECDSAFRRLANRNSFIDGLERQGYTLDFVGGHLVVYGLPYLDSKGELSYGDMASPVDLKGDFEIDRPTSHQVWFRGETPYGTNGRPLPISATANQREITAAFICQLSFSLKVEGQQYESFEEKISTYLNALTGPAREKFDAVPQLALDMRVVDTDYPLLLPDTMSARDGLNDLARRLAGVKVGIVGLGGTGSYILDFLAKTHLKLIRLYDDDIVHLHTLFRMPGANGARALGQKKVEVLYGTYSSFHTGLEVRAEKISEANVHSLTDLAFVFVAVDDGPSRDLICRHLNDHSIPFVDVGMGLYRAPSGPLNGMIRIAGGDASDASELLGTAYLPSANAVDNEYRRQPQIGELNALNAALAVVRFKQSMQFFEKDHTDRANVFEIATLDLDHYKGNEVPR